MDTLYSEPPEEGNVFREAMLEELGSLIRRRRRLADRRRHRFFSPDMSSLPAYERSAAAYRAALADMLGWPLAGKRPTDVPTASTKYVGEDSLGTISRVFIDTLPGVKTYGLFFRPPGNGPLPLVISQHGGLGTPELTSSFFGSNNYNDMTRRILRRGAAVFAPQLLLWDGKRFGPDHHKDEIDRGLKQLGGSLAALELFRIIRALDYFTASGDIDPSRIGMAGLSYGGFYTLFATALDLRIKVALSSCFLNNRKIYGWNDWVWFNSANRFLDYEVAALVCPRPLCVEVGKRDKLFKVGRARPEAARISSLYARLGIAGRLRYHEHEYGHELDRLDGGLDFLFANL